MKEIDPDLRYEAVDAALSNKTTYFTAQLYRLIAKADLSNRERIRLAFPNEVAAYERWYKGDRLYYD